ncbi:SPOR domain-containing protein [Xanthobacter tagetidis]|uniref:SPOR domain-containing protein n=1 Tax=Xanthobacter tagetidis TaxID=60216 RepID=A0A3L7ALT9_9HYPH|nr:SPOR domain-containing protein [Xanthobacter tagetidis]MBB6309148.1 hypothetical protein [Xanthobacter tagetidis]RLP80372.1 SPOR domain-containing protein [Xanthobacter tagetidis]
MVEESRFRYRRDDGMAGGGSATDARYAPRLTAQRAPAPDVRGIDRADGMSRGTAPGGFSGRLEASRSAPAPDYDRDYSRAPEPARDAGRPAASKDTLAELARLIGDQDPFAEFSDLERKAANAPVSEDDYDDDYADDDRRHDDEDDDDGEDDRRWDDRAPARADAYGRAPAPTAAPAARAAPQAPAYGRSAPAGTAAAADYGDDPYDDDDRYDDEDDAYDAPAPVAPRQAQLPAPRAAAAPASPAVRTGYGSLARQVPAPSAPANAAGRAAPSSYDDGYDDDEDDGYDRSRGYDDDEDDDGYAPARPATSAPTRAVDPRSVDPRGAAGRTFDARAADPRAPQAASRSAALPAPVPARADARRAPDAPAYGVKPQPAPAPARQAPQAASRAPQAPAYDDDYDDGYDDDGYGAKPADPRGYSAPAAARGRGGYDRSDARGSGEAAYAYSAERRDDGYDDYDDAYDPQFADAGYMPPHGEDVYETEPRRKKGRMALLMVASLLGLGVAGAAGFFAYRMAVGEATFGSATPSVIRADNAPVKTVAPPATDPQGKLITERLGAGGSANERLVTREETPVEVTAATRVATNGTPQGEPKRVKTYAVRPDGTMATPAPGTPPANGSVSAFAPTQAPLTSGVAAPAQTAALTPPVAAGGSYVVQVASQRSEADAQGSWKALQAKYPTLLGSYSAQVRKADLGERGVFYRAQVGPFASRDQANELCQALRGQGGDCIVNKN